MPATSQHKLERLMLDLRRTATPKHTLTGSNLLLAEHIYAAVHPDGNAVRRFYVHQSPGGKRRSLRFETVDGECGVLSVHRRDGLLAKHQHRLAERDAFRNAIFDVRRKYGAHIGCHRHSECTRIVVERFRQQYARNWQPPRLRYRNRKWQFQSRKLLAEWCDYYRKHAISCCHDIKAL